jgi:hypothetical protein
MKLTSKALGEKNFPLKSWKTRYLLIHIQTKIKRAEAASCKKDTSFGAFQTNIWAFLISQCFY